MRAVRDYVFRLLNCLPVWGDSEENRPLIPSRAVCSGGEWGVLYNNEGGGDTMRDVYLHRMREDGEVTLGLLVLDGDKPLCVTLEEPDLNNAVGISNIPEGTYYTKAHHSPKFGQCWWVKDVPNRSEILIHVGNTTANTMGCILVGMQFGRYVGNRPSIIKSKRAMEKLHTYLPDEFMLHITNMQDT